MSHDVSKLENKKTSQSLRLSLARVDPARQAKVSWEAAIMFKRIITQERQALQIVSTASFSLSLGQISIHDVRYFAT